MPSFWMTFTTTVSGMPFSAVVAVGSPGVAVADLVGVLVPGVASVGRRVRCRPWSPRGRRGPFIPDSQTIGRLAGR